MVYFGKIVYLHREHIHTQNIIDYKNAIFYIIVLNIHIFIFHILLFFLYCILRLSEKENQ